MEPPSAELVRTLRELKLCGTAELRQAARFVRVLANDLPTFDSVWIDALVQLRCLTHFQGTRLTEQADHGLVCGSHVLTSHLGRDSWYDHYRARSLATGTPRWLTRVDISGLNAATVAERLESTIGILKRFDQRYLHSPQQVEIEGQGLWLIGEPLAGRNLRELITRRGRWTPGLVQALAAQLATGLAALEKAGLCHGDVRLGTITLDGRGIARLNLPGVLAAVHPELTIHADFTPECTESLAPERVGVGSAATTQSDQYSLGCVLWHLLTGRPPYLSADPLTQVAQHQTRSLQDVRELAPDTPDGLWSVIARMTARDPADRYANWREVLAQLGHATHAGQRRLARFSATFERPAITARDWSEIWHVGKRWTRAAVAVLLVIGAVVWFPANRGLLLSLTGTGEAGSSSSSDDAVAVDDATTGESADAPFQLPSPDANGVVLLTGAGPWKPGELSAAGELIIRGAPGETPIIVIDEVPLALTADVVRIENMIIRRADGTAQTGMANGPLIEVAAKELHVEHCALLDLGTPQAMVRCDGTEGMRPELLQCVDSIVVSQGSAFLTEAAFSDAEFSNTLRLGPGPLLETVRGSSDEVQQLSLSQVTVRQSGPLWCMPDGACHLQLQVNDSILEFAEGTAWLEFIGVGSPQDWPAVIEISGEGTVATPGTIVGTRFTAEMPVAGVDESEFLIDGVFGGEFAFLHSASLKPIDSTLANWAADAPRQSTINPGIDAARLIEAIESPVRTGALE